MASWFGFILLVACFAGNTGIANGAQCETLPCQNGGVCFEVASTYHCICAHSYAGRNCEQVLYPCMSDPCLNGATCEEADGNYTCNCASFFSGVRCETEMRPCMNDPCMNGSTCVDNSIDSYTCICQAGYTGQNCDTDINECASNPCMNNATCHDMLNQYSCTCPEFYTGVNCETEMRPCMNDPCMNGSTCVDNSIDSYTCICQAGYTGPNCETDIDECASEPCMNNATCEQSVNEYSCTCAPFYSGVNCETEMRPCMNDPCMNGSTCVDNSIDSYTCICQAGYTGQNCDADINECASNPCMNNATCHDMLNQYSCTCPEFYTGVNCETEMRPCMNDPCMNGSTCVDNSIDSYTCICQAGYTGQNCDTDINECASNPCMNNATCHDMLNQYSCTCPEFYTGVNCETEMRPCMNDPCMNGSTCVDNSIDSYTCICQAGYTGPNCETDIDECASEPCMNNATCEQSVNEYSCTCAPFYSGVNCETEMRPCMNDPCMNGSTCVDNSIDSYTCICQAGYTGQNCDTDINECASNPCMNNATCHDMLNQYSCTCPEFYTGVNCETEMRPCMNDPCMNGSTCVDNSIDSHTCICQAGYTGQNCDTDINECASNPCMNNATCHDMLNQYSCSCPEFYTGVNCETERRPCMSNPCMNGATCTDIATDFYVCFCTDEFTGFDCDEDVNECLTNPCANGGTCVNVYGGYRCNCLFPNTGANCTEDLDICSLIPCRNGGTCIDMGLFGLCVCAENYSGTICENYIELPPCMNDPCMNGSTCVDNSIDSYTCICQAGYTGQNCDTDINECASNPCMNNATCHDMLNKYSCTCPEFYTGVNCETEMRPCWSGPCMNGSTCVDNSIDSYTCICQAGYTGQNCDTDINECASNPCMNNATCHDTLNQYSCTCLEFYTGVNCETEMRPCWSGPCMNGSTCVDNSIDSYTCICQAGYTGQNCDTDINECASNPCMNNATCHDMLNKYSCTCPEFYTGVNCETEMRPCWSGPCMNGSTCVDNSIDSYTCICQAGYTGQNCDTDINECASNPCMNNATCHDMLNQYSCTCPEFYTGVNCETGSTQSPDVTTRFMRVLNTNGSALVKATATTASPASFTLVILTNNPNQTAKVNFETVPSDAAFDVQYLTMENPEALILSFKTPEAANVTWTASLLEMANISLIVDSLDQSIAIVLEEEPLPTQMPTRPVVESVVRYLSTQDSTVVTAYASTASPANYTLVIYISDPGSNAYVSLMSSPDGAILDTMGELSSDLDALTMTFRSVEAVNVTAKITLMNPANITFQVDTADQSSEVVLAEDSGVPPTMQPGVVESFYRYLSSKGNTLVRASASTASPANYTLVIYTGNPADTAPVSLMTVPSGAAFGEIRSITDDPAALTMTFSTSEAVNATLLISLMEPANISLRVDTADLSSVVTLSEDTAMSSTVQPMLTTNDPFAEYTFDKAVLAMAGQVFMAFVSTSASADYILTRFKMSPEHESNVSIRTIPAGAAIDVIMQETSDSSTTTFTTLNPTNTSVFVTVREAGIITFRTVTMDRSAIVTLTEFTGMIPAIPMTVEPTVASTVSAEPMVTSQSVDPSSQMTSQQVSMSSQPMITSPPQVIETILKSFTSPGPSILKAFASTRFPANYTLAVYTRDPERTVNVSYVTEPDDAVSDLLISFNADPESAIVTFKTQMAVNTTVTVSLLESANVTFQVDSADPMAAVVLGLDDDMTSMQPASSTMSAEPSASPPMMSSQTMGPSDGMTSQQTPSMGLTMSPETNASQPMMTSHSMGPSDGMTSQQTLTRVTTSSESGSSSQPMMTSPVQVVETTIRSLASQGPSVLKAFASTRSPANYTLVVYTRDPERTVNVSYVTDPDDAVSDLLISFYADPESAIVTFKTQMAVNATVTVSLLESANVTFQVDSADPMAAVVLGLDDDMASMQPPSSSSTMSAEPSASQPMMTSQTMGPSDGMTSQQTPSMGSTVSPETNTSQPMMVSQTMGPSDGLTSQQTSTRVTMSSKSGSSSQPMMTSPVEVVETTIRSLASEGPSVVKAFASTRSPANYTLVVYTRDPERTVNVSYVTDPDDAVSDLLISFYADPESAIVTFKTQMAVNATVTVSLLESANVTFQVDSADPMAAVVLGLDDDMASMQPPSSSSTMSAEPSASQPMMTSQTMGPSDGMTSQQTPSMGSTVSPETNTSQPMMVSQTMGPSDGLTSQQTSTRVTMSSKSGSSSQPMMTSPVEVVETTIRSLASEGPSVVKAFASTRSPANYTLVVYTRDPERTVNVSYVTDPDDAVSDLLISFYADPESAIVTFKTQMAVNATVTVSLLESANVTFQVDSADPMAAVVLGLDDDMASMQPPSSSSTMSAKPSASQPMMTSQTMGPSDGMTSQQTPSMGSTVSPETNTSQPMMVSQTMGPSDGLTSQQTSTRVTMSSKSGSSSQPMMTSPVEVVETTIRSLASEGPSVVKAFASTRSPANYTLVIYTRNPEDVNVSVVTDPVGAVYDIEGYIDHDPEALVTTFKTSQAADTTVILNLSESANVTFQVDTADPIVIVQLGVDDGSRSTAQPSLPMSPTLPPATGRITQTSQPMSSVPSTMSAEPGESSQPMSTQSSSGTEEMTLKQTISTMSSGPASPTLSTMVSQTEPVSGRMTTFTPEDSTGVKTLITRGRTTVRASASTASPADYALVIFTRDPSETVNSTIVTIPSGAAFDIKQSITDNVQAMTFKTSGAVDTTVLLDLLEPANIVFQVDTDDQSSLLSLVADTDASISTIQPPPTTQVPTTPMTVQNIVEFLNVEGDSVVRASASTDSPANYTLSIYTANPRESVNVTIVTDPSGAAYDEMSLINDDAGTRVLRFKTAGSVDIDVIINSLEPAFILFQVDTADQSSGVVLTENTTGPEVVESFTKTLSTEGDSTVTAFVSTQKPANYSLLVFTRNADTANITIVTDPSEEASDVKVFRGEDSYSLLTTFKTSGEVETTVTLQLLESANISFTVSTTDQSILLALSDGTEVSTIRPTVSAGTTTEASIRTFSETFRSSGNAIVRASVSSREPAVHTLLLHTSNPSLSASVTLETDPPGLGCFPQIMSSSDPEALMIILRPSEEGNVTFVISLLESANITLTTETTDPSPTINFITVGTITTTQQGITASTPVSPTEQTMTSEPIYPTAKMTTNPQVVESFFRILSTTANRTVRASVSTASPATYTLVINSKNPNQTANVTVNTVPANAAYDVEHVTSEDPAALTITFKTSVEANTTILMNLLESANISLQVDTSDLSSNVSLVDIGMSPPPATEAPGTVLMLSTNGSGVVEAYAATNHTALLTLIVYSKNLQEIDVSIMTQPANISTDVARFNGSDGRSMAFLISVPQPANTTVRLMLMNAANITLQVDTGGHYISQLVEVVSDTTTPMVTDHRIGPTTEVPSTVPPGSENVTLVRELMTKSPGTFKAVVSTGGPGRYFLSIYIPDPDMNTQVTVMTSPQGAARDYRVSYNENPEAFFFEFNTVVESNTNIFLILSAPANISLSVETVGSSSTSEILEITQPSSSTSAPTTSLTSGVSTEEFTPAPMSVFVRELATTGPAEIQATASSDGPAHFELTVSTRNPSQTTGVSILTVPEGLTRDFDSDSSMQDTLILRFRVPSAAFTMISAILTQAANMSFRVETTDASAVVQLSDNTTVALVSSPSPTQPEATTVPSTPVPSTAAPVVSSTITRELSVPVGVTVQASASLDRPANVSFVIYTTNPAQVTGINLQTTPQGVARNFMITTFGNPDRYVMRFTTSAACTANLFFPVVEAANVSFIVELQGLANSSNQVELFIVGGPTARPVTTSPTPAVFVNTTQSLQINGPSQTSLLINARSAASVMVNVSGLVEFNVSFFREGAVQIQEVTSTQMGSTLRLTILSPVNITVTMDAQNDVEVVATVMSTRPDAALITIVTESEIATTSQPTVSPVTSEPQGTMTVVRRLQTLIQNSVVTAMGTTAGPANFTVEVLTPNPSETFNINIQTVPSNLAVGFNIFISRDQEKITYMFKTLAASETTVLMTLEEPGTISFTVTNVDDDSMVTLVSTSVVTPVVPEVMNVTRNITRAGAATSLVSIRTLEPSVIYLIINGSAEISQAAEPVGAVETETLHVLGSSVLKLTATVPANVTLFVTTNQAVVIQTVVESVNPESAVIMLEEFQPTNPPPQTALVMTSVQTRRQGDPMIASLSSIENGQLSVTWTFSESDEPFILGFILQYRENGAVDIISTPLISASARNYTLTNLSADSLYIVTVVAVDGAAASFQKPVMTLSRDTMDPVPVVDRQSGARLDLFHWILIGTAVLTVVLLALVAMGLLVRLKGKPKKSGPDGVEDPAMAETTA